LVPIAATNTLVLDPILPEWLPELVIRDLRVGHAKVTLRFWREAGGVCKWEVLHRQGSLHILRQPPPESLTATSIDRTANLVESLFR
jgi:hypothetical protein